MNENEKEEIRWISCPLVHELVQVEIRCQVCAYWNGASCGYSREKRTRRYRNILNSYLRRVEKALRLPLRSGRRLRIPPVWEKWPVGRASKEEPAISPRESEEGEYGVAGLLTESTELMPKQEEEEEEDFDSWKDPLWDQTLRGGHPVTEVKKNPQHPADAPGPEPPMGLPTADLQGEQFRQLSEPPPGGLRPPGEEPGMPESELLLKPPGSPEGV